MCDVPSVAVFCSESIECFPGTASKCSLIIIIIIIIIIITACYKVFWPSAKSKNRPPRSS